jgi:hypothetical protein
MNRSENLLAMARKNALLWLPETDVDTIFDVAFKLTPAPLTELDEKHIVTLYEAAEHVVEKLQGDDPVFQSHFLCHALTPEGPSNFTHGEKTALQVKHAIGLTINNLSWLFHDQYTRVAIATTEERQAAYKKLPEEEQALTVWPEFASEDNVRLFVVSMVDRLKPVQWCAIHGAREESPWTTWTSKEQYNKRVAYQMLDKVVDVIYRAVWVSQH